MDVLPEGGECLEVDGLQDMFGGIELQQQHDENAVVRQLLEFCLTDIMVLNQHPNYDTQHLKEQHRAQSESSKPAGQMLPAAYLERGRAFILSAATEHLSSNSNYDQAFHIAMQDSKML